MLKRLFMKLILSKIKCSLGIYYIPLKDVWLVRELAGHISSHIPIKNHTFSLKWLLCVSLNSHPLSGWRSLSRHQILLVFSLISGDPLVTRPEPIQAGCIAQVLLLHGGHGVWTAALHKLVLTVLLPLSSRELASISGPLEASWELQNL